MNQRTLSTTLAAFLLVLSPWAGALAQPAPAPDKPPVPEAPPPADKAPPDGAPGDKAPADKAPPESPPGDKAPADKAPPADSSPAGKAPPPPQAPPGKAAPDQRAALEAANLIGSGEPSGGPIKGPGVFADTSSVMRGRPIRMTSNGFAAWPILLVQAQATPYVGQNASFAAGDIAERPGFRLRRARFGLGGSYESLLHVRFTSELNGDTQSALTVRNAWIGFTPKEYFGAYMGIVDVPFSRSGLMPTADTALIDRPLAVRALSPFQQLGMLVGGSVAAGKLQYYLGLFNGFQRSDLFYSGYRDSMAALGNRFDNLAYAARVGTSLLSSGPEIAAYRDTNDQLNVGASYFFSDGGARDIHSMEGDIFFQKSGVRVLVEALYSITAPESVPTAPTTQTAKIDSYALVLEGGYTFRRALGGHLRFEWIDPNTAVADASDNWLLTAGLSFAPPVVGDMVKAQLEFTHREEVRGASLENDSLTLQTQFVLQ